MIIGSILEDKNFEQRIAITPDVVKKYKSLGLNICITKNYGLHLGYKDDEFLKEGAEITENNEAVISKSDILVQLNLCDDQNLEKLRENQSIIGILNPYSNESKLKKLSLKKINCFSLELLPRITRAQSMDILSSQANLAGYKAVIDSFAYFQKAIPMMMTAAGTISAAKVLVVGAGVAGLQAIATAKRLGAVVSATDVRSATKEQVESLGGKFIMVEDEESKNAETEGGYAKEMSDEYKKKQAQLIAETVAKQDIVICTALIPGKKAPVLITEEMVSSMIPGSVVIDLAVEAGGNCPLSKMNEIITHNGVKIVGYGNVPGRVAKDASALYSKNIFNFLSLLVDKENKKINFDLEDEITNSVLLTHNGEVRLEQFK